MEDRRIDELKEKVQGLVQQQHKISSEIRKLQMTLDSLYSEQVKDSQTVKDPSIPWPVKHTPRAPAEKVKRDLERFIGENLISKIGILITIIGVGIGTKYAIDSEIISPITRVILGYLVSFGLLGTALFLKKKYESFSAVILSGSLAILYFLTFASYDLYQFIGKGSAFSGMVVLTIATVYSALHYNKSIIAQIGMVGSYAVPFLLSDGSGEVLYLLIYITIINMGILAISIKKYWQSLHYSSLIFTWLIFTAWFLDRYTNAEFAIALAFGFVFFLQFYASFVTNKIIYQKGFSKGDIFLLSTNALIFYSIGFALISKKFNSDFFLASFTLVNALIHFLVALIVNRGQKENQALFRFILGLAIVYVTLTIPVLLDGAWVTVLWVGEAAVLSWAGKSKNGKPYEKMSFALTLLSFVSLLFIWQGRIDASSSSPISNHYMLVSLFFAAGMAIISFLNYHKKLLHPQTWYMRLMSYVPQALLVLSLYVTFALEINAYWQSQNYGLSDQMNLISLLAYSFIFLAGLNMINWRYFKKNVLSYTTMIFGLLAIPSLLNSTSALSDLTTYLTGGGNWYYAISRYSLYASIAIFSWSFKPVYHAEFINAGIKKSFDILFLLVVLWVSSVELINILGLSGVETTNKLSLSILWGISAVIAVAIGIKKSKKHLRISAMSLFGVTLFKLFFYDISHLSSLSKTVVLVALGMLMLTASFLYNRFVVIDRIDD